MPQVSNKNSKAKRNNGLKSINKLRVAGLKPLLKRNYKKTRSGSYRMTLIIYKMLDRKIASMKRKYVNCR